MRILRCELSMQQRIWNRDKVWFLLLVYCYICNLVRSSSSLYGYRDASLLNQYVSKRTDRGFGKQ